MTDPGFVVTIRDVYDKVAGLSDVVQTSLQKQATETAVLSQRMGANEEDVKELRKDREEDRRLRVNVKWQMAGVFVGSAATSILSFFIHH